MVAYTGNHGKHCNFNQSKQNGEVCAVNVDDALGPCSPSNKYGYTANHPCVFLKLNRIFKWTPDVYNITELPEDMPEDLKTHIGTLMDIEVSDLKSIEYIFDRFFNIVIFV